MDPARNHAGSVWRRTRCDRTGRGQSPGRHRRRLWRRPGCPRWLSKSGSASSRTWISKGPAVERRWLDVGGLLYGARHVSAAGCLWLADHDHVITLPNGIAALRPEAKLADTSLKNAMKLAAEFGLTPSARTRTIMNSETVQEAPDWRTQLGKPSRRGPGDPVHRNDADAHQGAVRRAAVRSASVAEGDSARPAQPSPGWSPSATARCSSDYLASRGSPQPIAALGLYFLLLDNEAGGEIYVCAGDRDQARRIFEAAKDMLLASPLLAAECDVLRDAIYHRASGSVLRVLSADAPTKHGLNPSVVLFDELHVQPNRQLWDVMTTEQAARLQPLVIAITTAGFDRQHHLSRALSVPAVPSAMAMSTVAASSTTSSSELTVSSMTRLK